MSTEMRSTRQTYIDDLSSASSSSSRSGSSVEEECEDDLVPNVWSTVATTSGMRDYDALDGLRSRATADADLENPEEDDPEDIETEDWELANGDFTKQYNRMRQEYAAVHLNHASSQRMVPLPARNTGPTLKKVNHRVGVKGVAANPKTGNVKVFQDKSQRATTEQVLDPRTRLVISGLINRGIVGRLERCVSTGKEANVYYAPLSASSTVDQLAVKVYRTSILNFRSRQAYIEGEFRFRGEYSSSRNPRKMVRLWAEKELRNLRRLEQHRVLSPRAIEVKENVLVMQYLGSPERAAPRLKDANMTGLQLENAYKSLLIAIRRMFQFCKLVHADLSEYNILYHDDEPYIIDVSQSVEQDHPRAFDFLRADIKNIEDFFKRHREGCQTLGVRRAWKFITEANIVDNEEYDANSKSALNLVLDGLLAVPADESEDTVFLKSFIPRGLADIQDPEKHLEAVTLSHATENFANILDASDTDEDSMGSSRDDNALRDAKHKGFRYESLEEKKERKRIVKEENRERRRQKMPKAEKAKLIRKTARR